MDRGEGQPLPERSNRPIIVVAIVSTLVAVALLSVLLTLLVVGDDSETDSPAPTAAPVSTAVAAATSAVPTTLAPTTTPTTTDPDAEAMALLEERSDELDDVLRDFQTAGGSSRYASAIATLGSLDARIESATCDTARSVLASAQAAVQPALSFRDSFTTRIESIREDLTPYYRSSTHSLEVRQFAGDILTTSGEYLNEIESLDLLSAELPAVLIAQRVDRDC